MYKRFGKRMLDVAVSAAALLVLSPIIVFIALLVRLNLGSPVIFSQLRPGLQGELFKIHKFRTMTNESAAGRLRPDSERLTPFGRRLRSLSLDELPELWNILKGEMSLVGPRPLLPEYLPRYNRRQNRRHEAKPGLTGLAQIRGRNALGWDRKFRLDVWYVDHLSFRLDLMIFIKTVGVVWGRQGVSSATAETMEPFRGNDDESKR